MSRVGKLLPDPTVLGVGTAGVLGPGLCPHGGLMLLSVSGLVTHVGPALSLSCALSLVHLHLLPL